MVCGPLGRAARSPSVLSSLEYSTAELTGVDVRVSPCSKHAAPVLPNWISAARSRSPANSRRIAVGASWLEILDLHAGSNFMSICSWGSSSDHRASATVATAVGGLIVAARTERPGAPRQSEEGTSLWSLSFAVARMAAPRYRRISVMLNCVTSVTVLDWPLTSRQPTRRRPKNAQQN